MENTNTSSLETTGISIQIEQKLTELLGSSHYLEIPQKIYDDNMSASDAVVYILENHEDQEYIEWLKNRANTFHVKDRSDKDSNGNFIPDRYHDTIPTNKLTGKKYSEDELDEWDEPYNH